MRLKSSQPTAQAVIDSQSAHESHSDYSKTRHFAFADEAARALKARGYDYGAELIREVVLQLPKLHLREQTV